MPPCLRSLWLRRDDAGADRAHGACRNPVLISSPIAATVGPWRRCATNCRNSVPVSHAVATPASPRGSTLSVIAATPSLSPTLFLRSLRAWRCKTTAATATPSLSSTLFPHSGRQLFDHVKAAATPSCLPRFSTPRIFAGFVPLGQPATPSSFVILSPQRCSQFEDTRAHPGVSSMTSPLAAQWQRGPGFQRTEFPGPVPVGCCRDFHRDSFIRGCFCCAS